MNLKELYIINYALTPRRVHATVLMLARMTRVEKARTNDIYVGGLITFLALAAEVATLEPMQASIPLDLSSCLAQRFIKNKIQD